MKERPLVILCVGYMLVLTVLHLFDLPLDLSGTADLLRRGAFFVEGDPVFLRGKLREIEDGGSSRKLLLSGVTVQGKDSGRSVTLPGGTAYVKEAPELHPGQEVLIEGIFRLPSGASNPGQFDQAAYDRLFRSEIRVTKGTVIEVSGRKDPVRDLFCRLRMRAGERIDRVYPEDTANIMRAMLLGEKEALDAETEKLYAAGGIFHLLVISSMHLTLLSGGLLFLLKKCGMGHRAAAGISGTLLIFFVIFTGSGLSSVRAVLLFLMMAGAVPLGRTYDYMTGLSFAAILLLLFQPYYLFYSGFQLTFGTAFFCGLAKGRGKMAGTCIIMLGSAPVTAYWFFKLPGYGLILNMILVPALPVLLITGVAGAALGGIWVFPAVWILRGYEAVLMFAKQLPGAQILTGRPGAVQILLYYAVFSAFLFFLDRWKGRRRKYFGCLFLPLLIGILMFRPVRELTVTFLDVGQGDGIVVQAPGGFSMVIDGGSSTVQNVGTYRILPFLESEGIRRIDAVALSHADTDHISGIRELFAAINAKDTPIRIKTLLLPALPEKKEALEEIRMSAEACGTEIRYVREGDSLENGMLRAEVLYPAADMRSGESGDGDNESSMVLALRYGDLDLLFTGDLEGDGEEAVTKMIESSGRSYEVLKAAHHGSSTSTKAAFLEAVSPKVSVISCGRNNRYGHPHTEVLQRLEEAGCDIYRTDLDGAVILTGDGNSFEIRTYLEREKEE